MKPLYLWILVFALVCAAAALLPRRAQTPHCDDLPAPAQEEAEVPSLPAFDAAVTLRVQTESGTRELLLRDYLIGAVLAEMPTDFPSEALRAQAVASRTFALRRMEHCKHGDAALCTSSQCCQGWCEPDGSEAARLAAQAVDETDGLVVTYDDALIEATFFSCSGGRTEAAQAVWGSDVPYLQSVSSPGEEDAPRYADSRTLTAEEFSATLLSAYPEANLSGTPESWIGAISRTDGGGIDTVFLGGVPVSGTALRRLFSLRSTDVSLSACADGITMETRGFGHRVGLSQYGARAMAEAGGDFAAILTHYYQGAEIKRLLLDEPEQPEV